IKNSRAFGSQLKDCIPVSDFSAAKAYESCDVINRGFTNVIAVSSDMFTHNLTRIILLLNQDKMNFSTLRNIQGLHAPLKLQMEFQAVKQVQRPPLLPSSNLSLDIWKGNCDCLGFEDILNDPAQREGMGDPHLLVEHKLGLL
uniref:Proteasome maturation protein n=1 Tax=Podarcis muralis TaxID=64176 RepID=A0A670HXR0_PODMU